MPRNLSYDDLDLGGATYYTHAGRILTINLLIGLFNGIFDCSLLLLVELLLMFKDR